MAATLIRNAFESTIRHRIEMNPISNPNAIKVAIANADVVSFDVFDTLLKRNVLDPADIFIAAGRYCEISGFDVPSGFVAMRRAAEKAAYESAQGEVLLEDIYGRIQCCESVRKALMQAEMDCELLFSARNGCMKELYDEAIALGKRVVLVSDMYLPKECVEGLLAQNGYEGYEELFLSSDTGVQKSTGKLFEYVVEHLGVVPADILHIGDTIRVDSIMAQKAGLRAVLIPRNPYNPQHRIKRDGSETQLAFSVMSATARNLAAGKSYYYRFGVEALGPLLLGLSKFVRDDMVSRGCDSIYFMARDGFILKQAFETLYGSEEISTSYMYASRRSICVPSVYSKDDLIEIAPTTRLIKVVDFLKAVGIKENTVRKVAKQAGYDPNERITKLESIGNARFSKLIDLAAPIVCELAKSERPAVIKYLCQQRFDEHSAVFDLGWAGNVQGCMNRLLAKELNLPELHGYYLGLDSQKARDDISYSSFLGYEYPSMYLQIVELCFSSQEGTTKGFAVNADGTAMPVLADYEFAGEVEQNAILEIQRGGLDFVENCAKYGNLVSWNCSPQTWFSTMKSFGTSPNDIDARALGDFRFEDNGCYEKLADPPPLKSYVAHPANLKSDLESSMWKIGFAKRLLKAPFPYHKALVLLKGHRAKKGAK